jgi:hypothetical protein
MVPPEIVENRISDMWKVVEDSTYSRKFYLDALYELKAYHNAFSYLRNFPAEFTPAIPRIKVFSYLQDLVNPVFIPGQQRYYDIENSDIPESRISNEEKIYFFERSKLYTSNCQYDFKKYKLDEPLFRN